MTEIIDGNAIAAEIRADLQDAISTLTDAGVTPGLATVLMSDDPASETYVSMKQRDCEEVGINGIHVELDPEAPAEELYATIDDLNADPDVHGILVQMPVPDHVDTRRVLRSIAPEKDADGFHPENVGRLVAGDARFKPCTPHGVQKLLEATGVDPEGKDVVVVGRSDIVGKPLANLLIQKAEGGNATVTVCHSRTKDLAAKTEQADIVVAAVGVPELVTGEMLSEGVTVVDVGVNRVDVSERHSEGSQTESDEADTEKGYELVGDVEFESAKEKASAITPVPGGVGPMTRAMLLYNTVKAAGEQSGVDVELP
ncbi:bifunctional methylenetetrahydrofolate dehydrogenase/methenyltetrahydrofolate cyclohydrolase [Haloprofundus sp. MHR1]|uniref:bifunctional methylenetetrahydrofolate dehydrogenase/methenyltetrahydrofolate cyclohydrolase n=1 Tax=Haloprofundus sp. MHR1 TaxID=2572921 RepID=UPI0010BED27C|nr:bifunctional methylenetetrahydrofolate dehydrogenase/methenyltetrahydrofolate cyclohydrolase [Haloprofundus sp. MHR1]QCJ46610.1 bifunctional methylenetetrahydrofolate dehydrogenase/methenyltetrahydrofolate cyclohydrolase [Haloprofundus sp. MHR1]